MVESIVERTEESLYELGWYHYIFLGVDKKGNYWDIFNIIHYEEFQEFLRKRAIEDENFLHELGKINGLFTRAVNQAQEHWKQKKSKE